MAEPEPWLLVPRPLPRAARELVVVPHAAGGPSSYRALVRYLPEMEVAIVAPPGREHRMDEPPPRTMEEWVRPLASALLRRPPRPRLLLGHSLGAVVAWELAHRLAAEGRPPTHLFLSARGFPDDVPIARPAHRLPDAELLATVRDLYGGFPSELDEHPELLAYALALVRADLEVLETTRPTLDRLDVPLTVLRGEDDRSHGHDDALRWTEGTTRGAELRTFPGGHFFLFDHLADVAAVIAAATRQRPLTHPRGSGRAGPP